MRFTSRAHDCAREVLGFARATRDGDVTALELFGGNGHLYSAELAAGCETFEAWDIDAAKQEQFLANVPGARFEVCDSVARVAEGDLDTAAYDLISLDNPLGIFGAGWCEHFEVLSDLLAIIHRPLVLSFNVVTRPYDASLHDEWMTRRQRYYGIDATELPLQTVVEFYCDLVEARRIRIARSGIFLREQVEGIDYFHVLALAIEPGVAQ